MAKTRIQEIDFLRAVFIILMVLFHLSAIGIHYPNVKQVVYSFHMPAFLVISGFLVGINKPCRPFFRSCLWIFIPYAIMETGYVAASSFLPVGEPVDDISFQLLLDKLIFHPLGPYWYLHTLLICDILCWCLCRTRFADNIVSLLCVLILCFYVLDKYLEVVSFANAMYFIGGFALRRRKKDFISVICPSFFALPLIILIICVDDSLNKSTLGGVSLTYLVMSFSVWIFQRLPHIVSRLLCFVGSNTLPILLFSPLFTMAVKPLSRLMKFDSTLCLFALVGTSVAVGGSLLIAVIMDKLRLSDFSVGRDRIIV